MAKLDQSPFATSGLPERRGTNQASILALGTLGQWLASCGTPPDIERLTFMGLAELTEESLAILDPDVILSPVISSAFDCVDVAVILEGLEYRGAYRAVTFPLPNPDIVRREVRSQCRGLDFDIVTVRSDCVLVS